VTLGLRSSLLFFINSNYCLKEKKDENSLILESSLLPWAVDVTCMCLRFFGTFL